MPTLSEFFGIQIAMRFIDHNPPHFHARYQNQKVIIDIENGTVRGEMSERALRLIFEWLSMHREELKIAWEKASKGENPDKITPLH